MSLRKRRLGFALYFVPMFVILATATSAWSQAPARGGAAPSYSGDAKLVFQFSTLGDSRQDPDSPDPTQMPVSAQDKIWLQNTKAWNRILQEIRGQGSNLLFFNGDMIMGYGIANVPKDNQTVDGIVGSDLMKFYRQYGFWRGMIAGPMETDLYVIPVPGNHETQWKAGGKKAQVENENAWRNNMADLILDDDRFVKLFGDKPSNENTGDNSAYDSLTTDQSKLTYSFDYRGAHFVVINTDPVGKDAHAPTKFLDADLKAARDRGVKQIFVFGHKPAYTYYFGKNTQLPTSPSGLDNDVAARDAFWAVIEKYGATYFCGHEHIYHLSTPLGDKGGKAVQVMVGSGGSPFEAKPTDVTINPQLDRDYAWATVKVYDDGRILMTTYGFDPYYGATHIIAQYILQQ